MKTSYALRGLSKDSGDVESRELVASLKQCGVWDDAGLGGWQILLELWESIDLIERENVVWKGVRRKNGARERQRARGVS